MALRLALLEAGAAFGAALLALALLGGAAQPPAGPLAALLQGAALAGCCLLGFYYADLYDLRVARSFGTFARRLPRASALAAVLTAAVAFLAGWPPLAVGLPLALGLLLLERAAAYRAFGRRPFVERVLVLGRGALARRLLRELSAQPRSVVVDVLDESETTSEGLAARLEGPEELRPDRIVVALEARRGRLPVRELLDLRLRGVQVEDGVEAYERLTGKILIESLAPSSLLFSSELRRSSRLQRLIARAASLAAAAAGLALAAPFLAVIALLVRLDSPGPVLFVQERAGQWGRPFRLLKFRTMRPTRRAGSEWVRDNEERITRLGRWLRKFRLDELPQLWNVLRGDMNLVGPRPHPARNYGLFTTHIPYYTLRGSVLPGITGWAQVRYGYANDLSEETEKMRYDLYYIKHRSLALDLRILFDTVKTMLLGRGAEGVPEEPAGAELRAG